MSSRGFWRTGFHVLGLPARSSGFHGCFRVIRGFGSFSCRSSLTMTCGAAVRLAQSEAGAGGGGEGGGGEGGISEDG